MLYLILCLPLTICRVKFGFTARSILIVRSQREGSKTFGRVKSPKLLYRLAHATPRITLLFRAIGVDIDRLVKNRPPAREAGSRISRRPLFVVRQGRYGLRGARQDQIRCLVKDRRPRQKVDIFIC